MKGEKYTAIYQDQRIAEEFCNFRCDYCEGFCPSGYSLKKDRDGNLAVPDTWHEKIANQPKETRDYFSEGVDLDKFFELSKDVMSKTREAVCADVLKISGGEVTLHDNLVDEVASIHDKYPMVQILTNGLNLNESQIDKYKEMGNICFQVSLDGTTHEGNYARTHNESITKKVLDNIDKMLDKGIGVEINCVLTKHNTDRFTEMLDHFKGAKNFIIVPRPVRGEPKGSLNFSEEQFDVFKEEVIEKYDEYESILPPKEYMDRLITIMATGKRPSGCFLPFFVLSVDGYGNIEACPCGLSSQKQPNVLSDDISEENILLDSKYIPDNKYSSCEYCLTQYEMINLYMEGSIGKDELKRVPSLNSETILSHVDEIKQSLVQKRIIPDEKTAL